MRTRKHTIVLVGIALAAALASAWTDEAPGQWSQEAKLVASDGSVDDQFGKGVALSGSTLVIGAESDARPVPCGSAYVFEHTSSGWQQAAKLRPADGAAGDQFGRSVATNGTTIIVGAHSDDPRAWDSGSAYVFEDGGGGWRQVAKLVPTDGGRDDNFGWTVAISGTTAIIGAPHADDYGISSGAAFVYRDEGSGWQQLAKLLPGDGGPSQWFGYDVAINGTTAIVGACRDDDNGSVSGSAYVFEETGGQWQQVQKLLPDDGGPSGIFGYSVAMSGPRAIIGAPGHNAAYVFEDTGSGWIQAAKIVPENVVPRELFGSYIGLSGPKAIIGTRPISSSQPPGAAYVFERTDSGWQQAARFVGDDATLEDQFGQAVAIENTTAVVGARWDDDLGHESGSAYIFTPEPASLLLLALGGLALTARKKTLRLPARAAGAGPLREGQA